MFAVACLLALGLFFFGCFLDCVAGLFRYLAGEPPRTTHDWKIVTGVVGLVFGVALLVYSPNASEAQEPKEPERSGFWWAGHGARRVLEWSGYAIEQTWLGLTNREDEETVAPTQGAVRR